MNEEARQFNLHHIAFLSSGFDRQWKTQFQGFGIGGSRQCEVFLRREHECCMVVRRGIGSGAHSLDLLKVQIEQTDLCAINLSPAPRAMKVEHRRAEMDLNMTMALGKNSRIRRHVHVTVA